ncbi:hypothetical protein [Undibacterium sp. WLHG33]|uniref:hypothetical protein n=1 Tax=Undibacterium sp. WLHG33 TaxID=3412482 RepID=UPI003C2E2CEE
MSSNPTTSGSPFVLLRAAEAATNWRALAMTGMAALAFFLSMAMTAWLTRHSFLLGGLFSIVSLIVGITGYSAVGILLMRQSQGRELSFPDAIIQGIFTVHRMLGVALVLLVIFLLMVLAAFAVLFLCKLPGLGPLLYAVMLPFLTVVIGVTFAGIFYVAMPLAAPAIWAGNSVMETIARLFVIVRQRLLMTITYIVVLSFLVLFLSGVVSFILFSGYVTTMGISQAVGVNPVGNMMGMMSGIMGNHMGNPMGNYMGYGGGFEALESGMAYTGAFGFATGLLFSVGMVIPFLTMINGTCLIYLQVTDGLNFTEAEAQLQAQMQEAKRRANEAKERAGAKLQEAKDAAAAAKSSQPTAKAGPEIASASTPAAPPAPVALVARTCSACKAPLAADDVFCGECGTKNPL